MDDQSIVGILVSMKKYMRVESSDSESGLPDCIMSCMKKVPPWFFNS